MLSSWFVVLLDYRAKTLQNKTDIPTRAKSENENEQQLSSQASPDEERSEHEARNKMEALAFDSIHCCLPRLYRCLETLN